MVGWVQIWKYRETNQVMDLHSEFSWWFFARLQNAPGECKQKFPISFACGNQTNKPCFSPMYTKISIFTDINKNTRKLLPLESRQWTRINAIRQLMIPAEKSHKMLKQIYTY